MDLKISFKTPDEYKESKIRNVTELKRDWVLLLYKPMKIGFYSPLNLSLSITYLKFHVVYKHMNVYIYT